MHDPTDLILHITSFATSFVEHWLEREMKEEHCYLTTHSHFYLRLYGVGQMVKDHYMGYYYRLAATVLYVHNPRQDSTYHVVCYTSRGTLAGTRNSSMSPPWGIYPNTHTHTHRTMSGRSITELHLAPGTRSSSASPAKGINPTIIHTTSRRSTTELHLATHTHSSYQKLYR